MFHIKGIAKDRKFKLFHTDRNTLCSISNSGSRILRNKSTCELVGVGAINLIARNGNVSMSNATSDLTLICFNVKINTNTSTQ